MTTRAEALEVMALIAAIHRRTAPRPDDEQATLLSAQAWAELFSIYNLTLPDLMAGVKKRALFHAEAPDGAKEILDFARGVREERAIREEQAREKALEAAWDPELVALNKAQLADTYDTVGGAFSIDPPQEIRPPLAVQPPRYDLLQTVTNIRDTAPPTTLHIAEGDPLTCGACGNRELTAKHEAARGVCDHCWPNLKLGIAVPSSSSTTNGKEDTA